MTTNSGVVKGELQVLHQVLKRLADDRDTATPRYKRARREITDGLPNKDEVVQLVLALSLDLLDEHELADPESPTDHLDTALKRALQDRAPDLSRRVLRA